MTIYFSIFVRRINSKDGEIRNAVRIGCNGRQRNAQLQWGEK